MHNSFFFKKIKTLLTNTHTRVTYKRKTRLYCVGAAKTGTHSINSMFNHKVRSGHEIDAKKLINKILKIANDSEIKAQNLSYIRRRNKKLCLDVDSSQLNFFLLDYILQEFPDALFLLTIRDCYSWLNSFINHSLWRNANADWTKLRKYRFQADVFSHPPQEKILKEKGLYTLNGYLSYWAYHNNKVLRSVPKSRLMIVKTHEISQKAYDIASFASLSKEYIQMEHTHSFQRPKNFNVLRKLDKDYLEAKIQEFCSPLMKTFFPEIQSIDHARL